jgi:hypothetical protein
VLLMSAVCTLCMVLAFIGTGQRAFLLTLALIAAGLPVYFYTRWRNGCVATTAGNAE